jgi:hypothetical protein
MTRARAHDTIGPEPGESTKQRVDRELHELLEEIRVALPGLELLFGFLLILPFTEGVASISATERAIYLACFLATAAATALLIAPSAHHRLGFRRVDKEQLLARANRQMVSGLALVALAIALVVYLVVSVILDAGWAGALAACVAGWFAFCWFVLPLRDHHE